MNKLFVYVLIFVVFVSLLMGAILFGTSLYRYVTAEWFGRVDAEVQLESAPSRIGFYNKFFSLCSDVRAIEGKIDSVRFLPEERQNEVLAGLHSRRASLIEEYNSMALRDYTAARFRANSLPVQIPSNIYNGNKTQCVLRSVSQ